MGLIWVLVANNTQARIFAAKTPSSPLEEIEGFAHNENRLHTREMTSDLPGRIKGEGGVGGHAFEQATDPKKYEASNFARYLAHILEVAQVSNKFSELLIVAEPTFLGLLREQLTEAVRSRVCFELDKNITSHSAEDIREHLPKYLPVVL